MKVRQVVSGVASGYLTKAIQFVAALAVVPFLLRSSVLGLAGYGTAFTLVAFSNFIGLLTDGPRKSFTRSISQAIGEHPAAAGCTPGAALRAGTRILFWLCSIAVLILLAFESPLLALMGLAKTPDAVAAYRLAVGLFWAENSFFLFRVPLLARGALPFVNYCTAFEVIGRSATFFLYFERFPASLTSYLLITVLFVVIRNLAFLGYLVARWPSDVMQRASAPPSLVRASLLYSGPISVVSMVTTLVNRLPILLAHSFLGATESGLIALVVNTIRSYVVQILFSVLDPIAVPIASRVNIGTLSAEARRLLSELEAVYVLAIGLVIGTGIAVMPQLVTLWLGPQYLSIVRPTQFLLLGCSCEIAFSIRLSLVVGQGHLAKSVPRVLVAGVVGVSGVVLGAAWLHDWVAMVIGVAVFPMVSELFGTSVVFERAFRGTIARRFSGLRMASFLLAAELAGGLISAITVSLPQSLGLMLLSILITLTLAHVILIPMPTALHTLRTLRRSLDRSVFGAAAVDLRVG